MFHGAAYYNLLQLHSLIYQLRKMQTEKVKCQYSEEPYNNLKYYLVHNGNITCMSPETIMYRSECYSSPANPADSDMQPHTVLYAT